MLFTSAITHLYTLFKLSGAFFTHFSPNIIKSTSIYSIIKNIQHLIDLQSAKILIERTIGRLMNYNFNKNQMVLEITTEVFKWLHQLGLVKQAKRNTNNLMEVADDVSNKLMDGFALGPLLRTFFPNKNDQDKLKKLDALKQNSTPAIRLYNWGLLTEVLKHLGVSLDQAEKSQLTNYDPQPLIKILNHLQKIRKKQPDQPNNPLKVDINQINKKSLRDTTNALQFLTVAISKNFKISPQQTLNLFLDNNKYLSHLLAKGVKNSFEPVWALLSDIKTHSQFIVLRIFCLYESQNVNFILGALRTCWISKDEHTAQLCCELIQEIYHQYRLSMLNLQVIRQWLKNEGLNTLFFAIKRHPLLEGLILSICYDFLDEQFFNYIQLTQKSVLWNTQRQKYSFYKSLIEQGSKQMLQKFSTTSYFQSWNKYFLKAMKKNKDTQEILLMVAILQQQWEKLGSKFEQNQLGLPQQTINFLKTLQSAQNQLMFVQVNRTLFSLMQTLGAAKNPFAPLIYKILITGFSTCSQRQRLVFMADNFVFSFKGIPSLPGTPIVQPLLKILQDRAEAAIISLCQTLLQQKRLNDQESLDMMQILSRIIFQDIMYGPHVLQVIFSSLANLAEEVALEFIENHSRLCLAQLYSLAKGINKSLKSLKEQSQRLAQNQNTKLAQNFISSSSKHITCKNLVGFISKAISVDQDFKKQSEDSIFHTYIKINVQLKKKEQAELLKVVMQSYYPDQDELEQRIAFYMRAAYPEKQKAQPKQTGHHHDHHDHSSLKPRSALLLQSSLTQQKDEAIVILDPALLKPTAYAIKDLQKVKQKRYELRTIELQRQKQRVRKQQKIDKFRTIQHQKRLVQSMTSIKNDLDYKHILHATTEQIVPEQTAEQSDPKDKDNKDTVSIIRLVNLQKEEEDSYRQEVQSLMKRYRKVWRYLFYKYSSRKSENSSEQKTHMGEVWKLLKQYEFNFLKKEDCFTIVRLINQNLKRKNDIQMLTYSGFEQFIIQAAMIGYSRVGNAHLSPGQQLILFIQQLKKITRQKAGSVQIFDNPDEAYFQQTEVIHQFNKRLKNNPEYILPEGYKRIKQISLQYEYDFHPMLQKNIKQSYVEVLEVLDKIFSERCQLGFHLIEPLSIKNQIFLARPALFQSLSQKMKDYTGGYLKPKQAVSASSKLLQKQISLPSPPKKKQFKPYINFSLGIKLGIAESSLPNKSIAEEVAYCMQDILSAIQNQSPVVINRSKRKITNQIMKKRRNELFKIETQRKKDEINWKKKAQSVKLQVQALREKRKEQQKQKKKKQYLDRKAKKMKEDKAYRQKMQEFQRVKQEIAEKKEALLKLKQKQQQKLKQQKQQYRQGVQEYFRKKKQQLKQKQQQIRKKKNEQNQKKDQLEANKKQFVKRLYVHNLKKQEGLLEKIDEIKENFDSVWKSDQIQDVLTENRKALKLLFDLLLKYEKSKISATNYDQIGMNTLSFFCIKFKIIPFMLQKKDLGYVFLQATKDPQDKKANRKGINYQKFQQVIFLISIKAKKILNKISQKQKKKEKRMQAFLNAQKSAQGNHFQAAEVQDDQQSKNDSDDQKPTLQDQYLFNAEDVTEDTIKQVFNFLKLPNDKASMEERYKEAMEYKNTKPRNILIKQLKQMLVE